MRWQTKGGWVLPLALMASVMFAVAALSPTFAASLGARPRGAWIAGTEAMTLGGVNIPLALFAFNLMFVFVRFGWRWADEIAVKATDAGLTLHPSTLLKPIGWSEIADVTVVLRREPSLLITLRNGKTRSIRGIDNENGAADAFAAYARAQSHRGETDRVE